jgi:hypothetical protein
MIEDPSSLPPWEKLNYTKRYFFNFSAKLMKNIKLSLLLGIFLLGLTPMVWGAFSSPTGLWDINSQAQLTAKFSDRKVKDQSTAYSLVQFKASQVFTSYDWGNIPGSWEAKSSTKYTVKMNVSSVNSSASSVNYLNRLKAQFSDLATTALGQAPTIQRIQLKSYTETGKLVNNGMRLQGATVVEARIEFTDPITRKQAIATLTISSTYGGSRASAPSSCCTSDIGAINLVASESFLTDNATIPGVQQTSSGLQYKILSRGDSTGKSPLATDSVTVNYRGLLPSGQFFDGNSGISFSLDGVIAGWTEGLQLMREGDYFRFYIPPELAYGDRSVGQYIKPNSALVFDVQLLKVN